jgi:mannitol 2-dehydrogenase
MNGPVRPTDLLSTGVLPAIDRPGYSRTLVTPGIAHIGVGNFHRVHQALYIDRCLHLENQSDWGIVGIGLSDSAAGRAKDAAFAAQDNLYTVTEYDNDGVGRTRLVGAMIGYLHAPADPGAVLQLLANPAIRIVSLTITEGGYRIDERTGQLDLDDPDIAADLVEPLPRTVYGFLTEALRRRRDTGVAPFTVVSCDNLRGNGDTTRTGLLGFARAKDPALADWLADTVSFPNSMVDRIAPTVTDDVRAKVAASTGISDALPAVAESYLQWVVQDRFPAGRPAMDRVGVQLRDDVATFEAVKGRMLNACHMLLSYPGLLMGYRFVHEAMADARLEALLRQFLLRDVIPHVAGPPGVVLAEYADSVLQRFANPAVGDQLLRIATDGATKIPTFHAKTISVLTGDGLDIRREALLVALYRRYLGGVDDTGTAFEPVEPQLSADDRRLLTSPDPVDALRTKPFSALELAADSAFLAAYRTLVDSLDRSGTAATIGELLDA